MSRTLASIRRVSGKADIPNKDRIELAFFDGWQIIVKKGEFNVGDLAVFVEIDSVLPERPEFEFLRNKDFRIKTMKMAGVLSQGICFPMDILPDGNYMEGGDVTEILGIKQYEKTMDNPVAAPKKTNPVKRFFFRFWIIRRFFGRTKKEKQGFPDFISKTDETRIQNIPHILENKDIKYGVTEKIDGQSGTFFLRRIRSRIPLLKDRFEFGVCSRNVRLQVPDNSSYWFVAKKYNIEQVLHDIIGENEFVAIQGECIGPNVQGNKYKATEPDLYVFNLVYPSGRTSTFEMQDRMMAHGLKSVPIITVAGKILFSLPETVNEILDMANGKSAIGDTLREGLVFRNHEYQISFKAVSPEFLIKYDE